MLKHAGLFLSSCWGRFVSTSAKGRGARRLVDLIFVAFDDLCHVRVLAATGFDPVYDFSAAHRLRRIVDDRVDYRRK
jgi:hypothetical protein